MAPFWALWMFMAVFPSVWINSVIFGMFPMAVVAQFGEPSWLKAITPPPGSGIVLTGGGVIGFGISTGSSRSPDSDTPPPLNEFATSLNLSIDFIAPTRVLTEASRPDIGLADGAATGAV